MNLVTKNFILTISEFTVYFPFQTGNEIVKSAGCYRPVAKTLKMDYPQIEYATYISYYGEDLPLHLESGSEKLKLWCVGPMKIFLKFLEDSNLSKFYQRRFWESR